MLKVNRRESKYELLRILSMFMIVVHHFSVYGHFNDLKNSIDVGTVLLYLRPGGKIGVCIFVMISTYFLIGKSFKAIRIINVILVTFFYQIVIVLILSSWGKIKFNLGMLIPNYWFITAYVELLAFMPALNAAFRRYKRYLTNEIFLVIFYAFVVLLHLTKILDSNNSVISFLNPMEFIDFTLLYVITFYIKDKKVPDIIYWASFLGGVILYSGAVFNYYSGFFSGIYNPVVIGGTNASPSVILCSIGIFGLVKNIKADYSWNFVNSCAGNVLGVYLIHENEYLRKYVWDIFNNGSIENGIQMLLFALFSGVVIFFVCCMLEYLRKRTLGNAFKKLEIIVEDVIGRIFGRSTYEE